MFFSKLSHIRRLLKQIELSVWGENLIEIYIEVSNQRDNRLSYNLWIGITCARFHSATDFRGFV